MERRDEAPKQPHYFTTDRFLKLFGLQQLSDLPQSQDDDRRVATAYAWGPR